MEPSPMTAARRWVDPGLSEVCVSCGIIFPLPAISFCATGCGHVLRLLLRIIPRLAQVQSASCGSRALREPDDPHAWLLCPRLSNVGQTHGTSVGSPSVTKGLRKGLTSYGDPGFSLFLRKAFIKAAGFSDDALERPIVGITNTFSDFNPCHGNVPQLIEAAKRGVMLSGGLPMEFPTISIHESFANPTSMFLRNLMAMDTEEMIRAQPMDAVILIGGCDKT